MTHSRLFLSGTLAIAGITAAFGFATETQALTISQVNTPGFIFQLADKEFYDFSVPTGTGLFEPLDTVNITQNPVSGRFQVDFNGNAPGGSSPITASGNLTYKVRIPNPPFTNKFLSAQQQTQGEAEPGSFTRTFTATGINTMTSINGANPSPLTEFFSPTNLQTISVFDTWTITSPGQLNGFSDRFNQDPSFPQPQVPEPSAVLGLLALGLCGTLVGRQKKG